MVYIYIDVDARIYIYIYVENRQMLRVMDNLFKYKVNFCTYSSASFVCTSLRRDKLKCVKKNCFRTFIALDYTMDEKIFAVSRECTS